MLAQLQTLLNNVNGWLLLFAGGLMLALLLLTVLLRQRRIAYWRSQALTLAAGSQSELTQAAAAIANMEPALTCYLPTDPDPYGPYAADFHQHFTNARHKQPALQARLQQLNSRTFQPAGPWWRRAWRNLWHALGFWQTHTRQHHQLAADIELMGKQVSNAWQYLHLLDQISAEVADWHQKFVADLERIAGIERSLHLAGVHGPRLAAAVAHRQTLARSLPADAAYLAAATPATPATRNKAQVSAARRHLHRLRPEIEHARHRFESWQADFQQIETDLARLGHTLSDIKAELDRLPPAIEPAAELKTLAQVVQQARQQRRRVAHLTVEQFELTSQDNHHLLTQAMDIQHTLAQANFNYQQLQRIFQDIAAALTQLTADMRQAEQDAPRPMVWGADHHTRQTLQETFEQLQAAAQACPPARLKPLREQASRLREKCKPFALSITQACQARQEILGRLNQPQLVDRAGWLAEAQRWQTRMDEYHPDDWANAVEVPALAATATALDERCRAIRAASLPAAELAQQKSEAETLAADVDRLRRSLAQVETTLQKIQADEERMAGWLAQLEEQLPGLLTLLAEATPPLPGAARKPLKKLGDAVAQAENTRHTFEARQQAPCLTRQEQAEQWLGRLEAALAKLAALCHNDIREVAADIKDRLAHKRPLPADLRKEAQQLTAKRYPRKAPWPGKKMPGGERVLFYTGHLPAQLTERANLHAMLAALQAHRAAVLAGGTEQPANPDTAATD